MCNNLAKIRKIKGVTQKELALKLGVSQRFVSYIENHKATPSLELAFKIKDILKVDIEEIFHLC